MAETPATSPSPSPAEDPVATVDVALPDAEAPEAAVLEGPPSASGGSAVPLVLDARDAVDPGEPRVATTLEVPPLPAGALAAPPAAAGAEGGEWDLLMAKVRDWLEQNDLPGRWERLGGPLRALGLLLGLLFVLKIYVALLDTLDDVPLLPRLLQLVGLIITLRFSVLRLTRSSDRQAVLDDWKRRWDAFRGA
ncbi:MAG: hypothetical protein RLZZ117_1728 [Cyanobacteriota bacterium]